MYSVVKLLNNEIDDVAVFDNEEAAGVYMQELADREEYQHMVLMWTKLNNVNMQVVVKEMRKPETSS